jgi:hypothetical protein
LDRKYFHLYWPGRLPSLWEYQRLRLWVLVTVREPETALGQLLPLA